MNSSIREVSRGNLDNEIDADNYELYYEMKLPSIASLGFLVLKPSLEPCSFSPGTRQENLWDPGCVRLLFLGFGSKKYDLCPRKNTGTGRRGSLRLDHKKTESSVTHNCTFLR